MRDARQRWESVSGGIGPETDRAVLVKLKDAGALARSQGSVAAFAQGIAPATIETKVYATLAEKLSASLKQQGVEADVTVVQPGAWRTLDGSHIGSDLAFMVGGAGIAALLYWVAFRRKK